MGYFSLVFACFSSASALTLFQIQFLIQQPFSHYSVSLVPILFCLFKTNFANFFLSSLFGSVEIATAVDSCCSICHYSSLEVILE
jgi:hypothetical protein